MKAPRSASPDSGEENDPAWKLLDHARKIPADPRFTAGVMRAMRAEQEARHRRTAWWEALFRPAWRPAWAAVLLAGVAGGLWLALPAPQPPLAHHHPAASPPAMAGDDVLGIIESDLAMLDEIDSLLAPQTAHDLSDADVELLLF